MWPDQVSNPGPPTYESGALPIALRGPANGYIVELPLQVELQWKGDTKGYLKYDCTDIYG